MTLIQERLINAYTVLVLEGKFKGQPFSIDDVPETVVTLEDGTGSTMKAQVELKVAERTVEVLG